MSHPNPLTAEAMEARIECMPWSGCWLWTAVTLSSGYGQYQSGGRRISAHRASYEVFVGSVPEGMCVCHRCDVPSCVNPAHLFLGTHQDNSTDMVKKGRTNAARGERCGASKLTATQVAAIRADTRTQREIATDYGVSQSTICDARSGKHWGRTC